MQFFSRACMECRHPHARHDKYSCRKIHATMNMEHHALHLCSFFSFFLFSHHPIPFARYDKQIKALNGKILEQRQRMGGINSSKENNAMITKQIRILENRLDKALVKFNEALAHNRKLREQIDNLRRERVFGLFIHIYIIDDDDDYKMGFRLLGGDRGIVDWRNSFFY